MVARYSCAVFGLGNIGSHSAFLAARLPGVGRVVLVDFDAVVASNLSGQDARLSDVGRSKAQALGRRLRAVRRDLEVVVHAQRLEDLPLGVLRADVFLGCLDSRGARMFLNERAVAIGVPLVDAGVAASGLLVRVSVVGGEGPCLECPWGSEEYAQIEAVHACGPGFVTAAAPTAAPAFLGAVAAALQVAACAEILRGERSGLGRETILDLVHGKLLGSLLRARPTCRMAPHRRWSIERLEVRPEDVRLEAALELGPPGVRGEKRTIACARGPFATRLRCARCRAERPVLQLLSSLTRRDRRCRSCGDEMIPGGIDLCESLELGALAWTDLRRSLASLGARVGDVFTVRAGEATRHFEIAAPAPVLSVAEGGR